MPLRRNYSRYASASDGQVYLYRSFSELLNVRTKKGIHCVQLDDTALEFLFLPRVSNNLVVIFHAAANPESLTLPIFVGLGITKNLDASVLIISDPTLEYAIPAGWFIGSKKLHLQAKINSMVRHVAESCGAEHLIYQGASAGGFAALHYSSLTPDSLAIAINPQTNLKAHYPERLRPFLDSCWDGAMPDRSIATTDLIESYREKFDNYVLYVQNEQDHFHITHHYSTWEANFASLRGRRWSLLSGDWGAGHAAPPPFFQSAILEYALTFDGKWADFLKSEEFD